MFKKILGVSVVLALMATPALADETDAPPIYFNEDGWITSPTSPPTSPTPPPLFTPLMDNPFNLSPDDVDSSLSGAFGSTFVSDLDSDEAKASEAATYNLLHNVLSNELAARIENDDEIVTSSVIATSLANAPANFCVNKETAIVTSPPDSPYSTVTLTGLSFFTTEVKAVKEPGTCKERMDGADTLTPIGHQEVELKPLTYPAPLGPGPKFQVRTGTTPHYVWVKNKTNNTLGASIKIVLAEGESRIGYANTGIISYWDRIGDADATQKALEMFNGGKPLISEQRCAGDVVQPDSFKDGMVSRPIKIGESGQINKNAGDGGDNMIDGCIYHRSTKNLRTSSWLTDNASPGAERFTHFVSASTVSQTQTVAGTPVESEEQKTTTDYGKGENNFADGVESTRTTATPKESVSGFGRFLTLYIFEMDDPIIDVNGCTPQPDGTCSGEPISIVKNNKSWKAIAVMTRRGCSNNPTDTNEAMSWSIQKTKTGTGEVPDLTAEGVFKEHGVDVNDPIFDQYQGKTLSYTMDDCQSPNVDEKDQVFATTSDTINSGTVETRDPLDQYSGPTSKIELKDRHDIPEKTDLFSTPAQTNTITTTPDTLPDKADETQGKETAQKGVTITRSNESVNLVSPWPTVTTTVKNTRPLPSDLVVDKTLVLVRDGSTPLVDSVEAQNEFNQKDGRIEPKNGWRKQTNPWIPDDDFVPVEKTNANMTDSAHKLDLKVLDSDVMFDSHQVPSAALKPWDDYLVFPIEGSKNPVRVSSSWQSNADNPAYVAIAYQMHGTFHIPWENVSVRPYGGLQHSWDDRAVRSYLTAVGPVTPLVTLKAAS